MQVRFAWPIDTLSIDPTVEEALKQCLLEPFENEDQAIAFWNNTETTLVHIQSRDDAAVYPLMGKLLKQKVAHGLKYIEHSFALPEPYRLTLSVTDDAGNGVYLLIDAGNTVAQCFKEDAKG